MNNDKRLRELREMAGLSQSDLAKIFGKSQVAISKYENGSRELDYEMLKKYAKHFNVTVDYILGRTNSTNEYIFSSEDYPDILKPFIYDDNSWLPTYIDDYMEAVTKDERKKLIENKLKNIYYKYDENIITPLNRMFSFLPDEMRNKPVSLYDALDYMRNDRKLMKFLYEHGFNKKGELIIPNKEFHSDPKNNQEIYIDDPINECNNPVHRIPIYGHISAGLPLYANEDIIGYTYTEHNGGVEYFGLVVTGDSMNGTAIYDGSIIIVRKQQTVDNGQVAVVLVNGEDATVKRFYKERNIVTLIPQSNNPIHKPQMYNLKETPIEIIGRVVEVKNSIK